MASKKQKFEIEATVRHDMGKGASRRLRREQKVPGVIYGGGKAPVALTFEHKHVAKSLENEAFYSHILTLKTGSESERVILKDVQRHPYKPRVTHVDFQRVRADEKLHMHIPLHFVGADKAPGVKDAGGLVSHIMSDVEIACLPDDLPEFIEVDISEMQLNQILHLSDIKLPKGVEIVALSHDDDKPVVSVHMPRVEEEPVVEETEAPAPSEVPAIAQKGEEAEGEEK
ncbi:50S ribosomal protein L25 [Aquicella siphonis]|uniref:Large ribosomal subunit protein bL25 n=1 Tax=Aquicella siphonis TaxID=254247 RepID=A0A5E4PI31_9COXI|nr:50S ribosomal protein L25/general stress protein Ctc [Aquicella siphonis]VVC76700.1 50S ribosomal protein L25 [Aquicella siphonis]